MTDKHTPGPWRVDSTALILAVKANNRVVAVVADARTGDVPASKPDARLIAAAPELLTALLAIKAEIDKPGAYRTTVNAIDRITQSAIAKAVQESKPYVD